MIYIYIYIYICRRGSVSCRKVERWRQKYLYPALNSRAVSFQNSQTLHRSSISQELQCLSIYVMIGRLYSTLSDICRHGGFSNQIPTPILCL